MAKQTVLITGGSSGIGFALAEKFAKEKYELILVSRKEDSLKKAAEKIETTYAVKPRIIPQDLTEPNAARTIFEKLMRTKTDVDILVNNAGFGRYGDFADILWKEHEKLLQVNIIALTQLTRLLLPGMIARRYGKILNVSSTAAFQPGPHMAVYFAAKAYVLSFSQAIREEVEDSNVSVTTLCPGPTKSDFAKRAKLHRTKLFNYIRELTIDEVASAGFTGMMRGTSVVIPGRRNKLLAAAAQLSPAPLRTKTSRSLLE